MEDFIFQNTTKMIFGRDSEKYVGIESKKYGKNLLFHYGNKSIKKFGLYEKIIKHLKESDLNIFELGGVQPNPKLKLINEGIKICRENSIDVILAAGGGSVIDSAKAISIGTPYKGNVWDFFDKKALPESAVPLGAVVTIPASGSEFNDIAVISNEYKTLKRSLHNKHLFPKFAVLNPGLTFTLSAFQTACTSADIMSHTMERYFTQTRKADLTDRFCEANIKTIIENTPIVIKDPSDYDARAEIMLAGSMATSGIIEAGRIVDGASHKLAHEAGAEYDTAHGLLLAVLYPAWMEYVCRKSPEKFVQFSSRIFGIKATGSNPVQIALEGIKELRAFFKQIGLPSTLREIGIGDEKFEIMSAKATASGPVGNYIKLYKDDCINVYRIAL